MGFPRKEYRSGLPFSTSRTLPNPRIKPPSLILCLLHWQVASLPQIPLGKPILRLAILIIITWFNWFLDADVSVRMAKWMSQYSIHIRKSILKDQIPSVFYGIILLESLYSTRLPGSDQVTWCRVLASLSLPLWRRQWHPTPVLLPGKSHGRRSLVGCSPWGR